ncbi:MAG TPA: TldD/PmbA family protein [Gemmatimonadaceae bacterium]|nr:TldD/PmbA family protein [Gemmatimonadaceae bacterium]
MPIKLLSRDEVKSLTDRALAASAAVGQPDDVRVNVQSGWTGNTRFAGGEITTAGGSTDTTVAITSSFGRRTAAATTNLLDDASLRRTAELSQRLAKLSPEDPEALPTLGAQPVGTIASAYAERTADLTPEARALAVQRVLDGARSAAGDLGNDLFVAGYLEANAGVAQAVATSRGLFAYHASSDVTLSTTARTPDGTGSGYAVAGARDWSLVDPAELGRRAARKAVASRNPQAIEPGQYTVVLEPQAVADLISQLPGSFQARAAEEGRSPFSKKGGGTKVGERIADPRVTLFSDPTDPDLLGQPFDAEGLPIGRTVLIDNGVLKDLVYSRYWAQRRGVAPTGGAATFGGFGGGGGGIAGGLKMAGGSKSVDELIAGTERGVLVTHFFYIRFLDQRTVMVTGLTRDGTFLIEKGKVTRPLKNFRFNESPLFMLNKIDDLGRAERVRAGMVVPSLRVRDFNFSSLSDAV